MGKKAFARNEMKDWKDGLLAELPEGSNSSCAVIILAKGMVFGESGGVGTSVAYRKGWPDFCSLCRASAAA